MDFWGIICVCNNSCIGWIIGVKWIIVSINCDCFKISIKVFIVMMFIIRFWVEIKIVNIKL